MIVIFVRFSAHDSPETIELEINTGSSEGLILWQGVVSAGPVLVPETRLNCKTEARFIPNLKLGTHILPLHLLILTLTLPLYSNTLKHHQ